MRELIAIAHIQSDFPTKFGVPRQSGLVRGLRSRIVFEPAYRAPEALRGLEHFSHIWLLWDFSEARQAGAFKPTVRPPRLGGNKRLGVFATRSPYRPNNIGLSSVRILSIQLHTPDGPVIEVEGADMMNGTPIFDIKPYLAFTDSHPEATGSIADFSPENDQEKTVVLHPSLAEAFDAEHLEALKEVLSSDPRPHYHDNPQRVYAFQFAGREVKFSIADNVVKAWIASGKP